MMPNGGGVDAIGRGKEGIVGRYREKEGRGGWERVGEGGWV